MPSDVTYCIAYEDQLSFSKLHQLRSVKPYALFLLCLVITASVIGYFTGQPEIAVGAAGGGLIALVIVPLIVRLLFIPIQTKRAYREFKVIQEEMTLSLSANSFSIDQASGSITSPWEHIIKWDENDQVMALYPQRQMAYIFPKVDVGAAHIEFMKERLIESGLTKKGKLRK